MLDLNKIEEVVKDADYKYSKLPDGTTICQVTSGSSNIVTGYCHKSADINDKQMEALALQDAMRLLGLIIIEPELPFGG